MNMIPARKAVIRKRDRVVDREQFKAEHIDKEANRLIDGGGVRIDSAAISDKALKLGAGTYVVQVGKRKFVRVSLA